MDSIKNLLLGAKFFSNDILLSIIKNLNPHLCPTPPGLVSELMTSRASDEAYPLPSINPSLKTIRLKGSDLSSSYTAYKSGLSVDVFLNISSQFTSLKTSKSDRFV